MADDTYLESGGAAGAPPTFVEASGASAVGGFHGFQPLPPALSADGYQVISELGSGAEARVWLCDHSDGKVAVKVYHRAPKYAFALDSPEYLRHFDPAWTVRILRRGCDRVAGMEMHYEVMEYCAGGTLEEFVAARGPSDELATLVVHRLTGCIRALQGDQRKVVHGDLKPRNVLVRDADHVELVLADFGLTIDLGERSQLSNLGQGTTAYNAPEILRYKGAPADWWSLGMVMYTVLVGHGYYQLSVSHWLNQAAIEADLISRDVSLAALDGLGMPPDRIARWKILLAGLLTRDPNLRWGAAEVEDWLAGDTPALHRSVDTAAQSESRAVTPFAFAGVGEFTTTRELGLAIAERPGESARMLSGKGTARLVAWLRDDARTDDDFSELAQHTWDPDAKVTYFVSRLAPEAPITFRSHPITSPADLRRLVQSAESTVVDALFDAELLGALANDAGRAGYRMIEANWQDLVSRAFDAARNRGVPVSDPARAQIRRHALLLAASDEAVAEQYANTVRLRLDSSPMAAAREVDWFVRLRADAGI